MSVCRVLEGNQSFSASKMLRSSCLSFRMLAFPESPCGRIDNICLKMRLKDSTSKDKIKIEKWRTCSGESPSGACLSMLMLSVAFCLQFERFLRPSHNLRWAKMRVSKTDMLVSKRACLSGPPKPRKRKTPESTLRGAPKGF